MGCSPSTMENKEAKQAVKQCTDRKAYMERTISAHSAFAAGHSAYAVALKNIGASFTDYALVDLQFPDPPLEESSDHVNISMEVTVPLEESSVSSSYANSSIVPLEESSVSSDANSTTEELIKELQDGFPKASESSDDVSKILEAHMFHSINSSPDTNNHGIHLSKGHAPEEKQTHSKILKTILAWEEKLYNEVKAGEMMKNEYKKKVASLHKLTKRGTSTHSLVQTKERVRGLHATCTVQTKSISSTISEINRIRDEQLYPKLLQLVNEMGTILWETIGKQQDNQLKMMHEITAIKISQSRSKTNEHISIKAKQLHLHVKLWCAEFHKLVQCQKDYIISLSSWLKVNLMPIDDNLSQQNPEIYSLLDTWQSQLMKLQGSSVKISIHAFAAAIDALIRYQSDKTRMIKRCDATIRETTRKSQKFKECRDKKTPKRNPTNEKDTDVVDDTELTAKHQIVVDALKRRLEEEEEEGIYRRLCVQVKDTSLGILKDHLPKIFMDMLEFSHACSRMYESLKQV